MITPQPRPRYVSEQIKMNLDRCHFCDLQARYSVGAIWVCKECL